MKVLSALLYYLVLLPASWLPFTVLHWISFVMYVFLYHIFGYRKKVVLQNIRNSFPEKTNAEHLAIAKAFYKNLCDVLLEGFKIFSISKRKLQKHIRCINPELINRYFEEGKNVIITVGHYNSWELMLTAFNIFIKHKAVVIYQPLSNPFFDKKLGEARGKQGTRMIPSKEVKTFFNTPSPDLHATVFAIDQSPGNPKNCYWMNFLHQETGVLFGAEKYAKEFDLPVVYARLNKVKRGYYTLEFSEVSAHPKTTAYGEITEKSTRLLEADIIAHPESWLWSHKRWKHKRPSEESSPSPKAKHKLL